MIPALRRPAIRLLRQQVKQVSARLSNRNTSNNRRHTGVGHDTLHHDEAPYDKICEKTSSYRSFVPAPPRDTPLWPDRDRPLTPNS